MRILNCKLGEDLLDGTGVVDGNAVGEGTGHVEFALGIAFWDARGWNEVKAICIQSLKRSGGNDGDEEDESCCREQSDLVE